MKQVPNLPFSLFIKKTSTKRFHVYANLPNVFTAKVRTFKSKKSAHKYISSVVNFKKQKSIKQINIDKAKNVGN